ncbi:hypothetical protein [Acinetobacter sp. F16]|uniref:hypothetical protein n=1 Tax=Acinetobacter sp. F16 TaxID=3462438 RepID=UPI0040469828
MYQAVVLRFNFNFGSCKTYGDIILVFIAGVSAYLCLHTIIGVREGTIMTALCVGSLVKMILPKLNFIDFNAVKLITSKKQPSSAKPAQMEIFTTILLKNNI